MVTVYSYHLYSFFTSYLQVVSRQEEVSFAFKSSSYFFWKFFLNPFNIFEIIPTKIDLLTKIHANLLINTKTIKITTLNRHEMLSTVRDFLNCGHRNEKHLILGLSLNH